MIKVGITGQSGFIGTHLFNTLGLYSDQFQRIPFNDMYFQDFGKLKEFVASCDAIVHLAGMNRHNDPQVIYNTNIMLVKQLITACESAFVTPHILFSSSTQEDLDNLYGKSKRIGRELFIDWAERNNAPFTGLVIPNVFGPFGSPYYNSVIATFCHQLTHNETPKIERDSELKLIYVSELVKLIIDEIVRIKMIGSKQIRQNEDMGNLLSKRHQYIIPPTTIIKVSALLNKLQQYKCNYYEKGEIPNLDTPFDRDLWNTFLCYIDYSNFFPFLLKQNIDRRGTFVEVMKINSGGQISFSTTEPGQTRGNHFHTRKVERFAVIKGKAQINLRRINTEKVIVFNLDGSLPSFVDIPIWHTHNITNIGNDELYTIFWINEHYDATDPDTFYLQV